MGALNKKSLHKDSTNTSASFVMCKESNTTVIGMHKNPDSRMKVPPDHYNMLHATSKGHTPLLILVATMGKSNES